jgi:hypothetical protein
VKQHIVFDFATHSQNSSCTFRWKNATDDILWTIHDVMLRMAWSSSTGKHSSEWAFHVSKLTTYRERNPPNLSVDPKLRRTYVSRRILDDVDSDRDDAAQFTCRYFSVLRILAIGEQSESKSLGNGTGSCVIDYVGTCWRAWDGC